MDTLELSPSYIVDETGFDWDYSAIDDNIEAQKLLAAAITSNRFHSGMPDESEKRKLEELEDAVQRSPTKAMHNDYSDSILHSEEDTKSQDGQEQKQGPKKPGRKPLTTTPTSLSNSDPKQKRKAQNRAAQRAFRERKERYVKELEERIKELESSHNASSSVLQAENQQLKSLVQKLEAENYVLKGANFTFDFPIQKAHLKLGNLAVVSDSAKISQEDETTVPARDPWTPPSSNESDSQDSEPASPVSSGAYGSPDPIHAYTDDSSPQSDMQKSSPAMPSVFAFDDEVSGSSHPTPPSSGCEKTMKDGASFCDKLEEEVCGPSVSAVDQLLSEPIFDNTGALNASISNANLIPIIGNGTGTTSFHERSALFTEFRDPSLYHNTFAESVPIPPLFQDDLDDYGTYPPMLTPRDEVKTEPLGGGTVSGEFAPTPANAQRFQHIPHQDTLDPEKKLISCTKVWETISEHPRFEEFDVDELCSALKAKAKCSGHGPVVAEDALKEVLARLDRGNTQ